MIPDSSLPFPEIELDHRLSGVRLFLCDVDGVLTDASVAVGEGSGEVKLFNIHDGLGLVNLREQGVPVGWISSRPSPATAVRAAELKIDFLVQSRTSKVAAIEDILRQTALNWEQVCYMGDDIVDLGAMKRAGVAIAPANAVEEIKAVAQCVTGASGGHGAVREACEMILKAQGKWDVVLAKYEQ